MKEPLTIYLPPELAQRFKYEATRQGLSLSAYVTKQLASGPSQMDSLQNWLAARLDRIELRISEVGNGSSQSVTA